VKSARTRRNCFASSHW